MAPEPSAPSRDNHARYPCAGCSAPMEFDPASGALKCSYCGRTLAVSRSLNEAVRELPYEEFAGQPDASKLGRLAEDALELTCKSCGATVQFRPGEVSGACSFCAAPAVAQPKAADPLIAPNGVLPFAVAKESATAKVRHWLASRWFAPSELKKVARPEGIHGVYLPFWTYDAHAHTGYTGQRGDYYYETVEVVERDAQGRQVVVRKQVRRTRWTGVSGAVDNTFDDVLVPASRSVGTRRLNALEPWELEHVCVYEPAYLAGFQAERYRVPLAEGRQIAERMMEPVIEATIRRDIAGDEQRIDSAETRYSRETFKHLLLPAWIGAYRFRSKVYQVIVNARTGEVQGERPYSAVKIALLVLVVAVAVLVIGTLAE